MTAKQLQDLLRDEIALQTRHCRHLEAQQRALIACDRDEFRLLQEQYVGIAEKLEAQSEARSLLLQDEMGNSLTLADIVHHQPMHKQASLNHTLEKLKSVMQQAQLLCRSNQQLIENELNYITFSLDLFVDAGRRADANYGGHWNRRKLLDRFV